MIVARAPLRISFVGGGTDLPAFYRKYPGRVISVAIDKYIYAIVHPLPLVDKFIARYSKTELVDHPKHFLHNGVRAALLDLNITEPGLEVNTLADLPAKTGLGSSSSFSAALLKALHAHLGQKLNAEGVARAACRLEIELLKGTIGKQDQYAAAYGGLNFMQFNKDESVEVRPIFLDYEKRSLLEDHIFLFFTGITRSASTILKVQSMRVDRHLETYKKMSVPKILLKGNHKKIQEFQKKEALRITSHNRSDLLK